MCHKQFYFVIFFIFCNFILTFADSSYDNTIVLTVATNVTNGLERYLRSARVYNVKTHVLGLGTEWRGGDVKHYAGGGQKINLLRAELEQYKDDKERIILFTDSYDVIFLSDLKSIVKRFLAMDARVVFSAESSCWPDKSLAEKYPVVDRGKRFLNSGGFIGYANDLYSIISHSNIEDSGDDQLYYTNIYLDESLRNEFKIKLDHTSEIFQNLYGAVAEVQLQFENNEPRIENIEYKTHPLILHGNGLSKTVLNSLGNYLAKNWNLKDECIACWDDNIKLNNIKETKYPVVLISVFVEQAVPFLEEFFEKIHELEYPKNRIHLFIRNSVKYHIGHIKSFVKAHGSEYINVKQIIPEDSVNEWDARNMAIEYFLKKKCDYYFNVDGEAHLDNPYTLKLLIEQNRTIVAPLLVRTKQSWSNFWGALTTDGFYARSFDYMQIVHNERRGLWNVPFISSCYLINATLLHEYSKKISYIKGELDADMAFCANLRELDVFMYVSNRIDFGHLINPETFDITRTVPEMYQIFDNRYDWEQRYIHKNFSENFKPNSTPQQPCPDVYWFPVTTMRFCNDLINMMEAFGQWSDGKNTDSRLDTGYEAVPTRDIHMNQVGWERHWLFFLKEFVRPLQELVFTGYYHDPPRALMNFVVRYRLDEQPSLRPHHDSSTYTINLALNTPGQDYEGGGCRFLRYNCSVTDTRPGWLLMHPGRLTHFHEGLPVKKGTRYIMISFVDP